MRPSTAPPWLNRLARNARHIPNRHWLLGLIAVGTILALSAVIPEREA